MTIKAAMEDSRTGDGLQQRPIGRSDLVEICLIFGLILLFAGWPAPDVNEAHYLAKAKNYWNPQWCGDDIFLDSAEAHTVFYGLFGWMTLWAPLSIAAWGGRLMAWGLVAIAWQRISNVIMPRRFVSVLTAALFLVLSTYGHLAGEWAIGGFEAKSIAYGLVLVGVWQLVLGHWRWVWVWLGAAAAVHVLVGGWSTVAAAIAWLIAGSDRPSIRSMLPGLAVGAMLSLCGLVPAIVLTLGVDSETGRLANEIYVFHRLAHHLVFLEFRAMRYLAFGTLLLVWGGLTWQLRRTEPWARLNRLTIGAMVIAVAGVVINLSLQRHPALAAALLRFYWFRLSDVCVPLAIAMGWPLLLVRWEADWPRVARAGWSLTILVPTITLGLLFADHQLDYRPRSEAQSHPVKNSNYRRPWLQYQAWRGACHWIREHTPPDARFLTPRRQQTFKWYAGRAEAACWKDIPQDAASIVQWWRLMQELYPRPVAIGGLGSWSDRELQRIADAHRIDYIVVERRRSGRRLGFPLVYPLSGASNAYFEVYKTHR